MVPGGLAGYPLDPARHPKLGNIRGTNEFGITNVASPGPNQLPRLDTATIPLTILDEELRIRLTQCLFEGFDNPAARAKAYQLRRALEKNVAKLEPAPCGISTHIITKDAPHKGCIWCQVKQDVGIDYFPPPRP